MTLLEMATARPAILIVIILVIGVVYFKAPGIANAGIEIIEGGAEEIGLPLSSPKILSITPSIESENSPLMIRWRMNNVGDTEMKKSGADYKIDFFYKEHEADANQHVCTAFAKGISREVSEQERKARDLGYKCDLDKGTNTASLEKISDNAASAGMYEMRLRFKKDGNNEFEGMLPRTFNFFTESYVEQIDSEFSGCGDSDTRNCNVAECKGMRISHDFRKGLAGGSGATNARDAIRAITENVIEDYDCVEEKRWNGDQWLVDIERGSCSPEEIDEINKKFSRVRLLMEADDLVSGQQIVSEDSYIDHLDILPEAKRNASAKTQFCSKPAYAHLLTLGWQAVGTIDRTNDIEAEIDRVLRHDVNTAITNFEADAVQAESRIDLSWDSIGQGNIGLYSMDASLRKHPEEQYESNRYEQVSSQTTQDKDATKMSFFPEEFGLHKFDIFVSGSGDGSTRQATDHIGVYTEEFVELMDRPEDGDVIFESGCVSAFGGHSPNDCTVIECKRNIINYDFPQQGGLIQAKNVIRDVSTEFRIENGITNDCGEIQNGVIFKTGSCTSSEIDALNTKVVKVRYEIMKNQVEAGLRQGWDLKDARDYAIDSTMSCAAGPGKVGFRNNVPNGAYATLQNLENPEWKPLGEFGRWRQKAVSELDTIPRMENLEAGFDEYGSISISWDILPESSHDTIKKGTYEIKQVHKVLDDEIRTETKTIDGSDRLGRVVESYATEILQPIGSHDFEIRFVDRLGSTLFVEEISAGRFGDDYIEFYAGGNDGCIDDGDFKLDDCDVVMQKKTMLQTHGPFGDSWSTDRAGKRTRLITAYDNYKSDVSTTQCEAVVESNLFFLKGNTCSSEDIDGIYKEYMELYTTNDYDCESPLGIEANAVCKVKKQTIETLQGLGWKDDRINKGWEDEI
jgi:hypothetical protein